MTPTTAILDASALIRAFVVPIAPAATAWVHDVNTGRIDGYAPQLIYVEVANALRKHTRSGELEQARAEELLGYYLSLPLEIAPLEALVMPALRLAFECGVSAYDGCYLALARALDGTIVTADRRLAEHHDRVALIA